MSPAERFRFSDATRGELERLYSKRCELEARTRLIRELEVAVHNHEKNRDQAAAIVAEDRGRGRPRELWRQQLVDDIVVVVEGHLSAVDRRSVDRLAATSVRIVLLAAKVLVSDYRDMLRDARDPRRRALRHEALREFFRDVIRNKHPLHSPPAE